MSEEDVRKEIQRLNDLYIKENDKKILYSREVVDSLIFAKTNKLEQENKQLKEELQKADSITQSCIFEGKEESTINFRECLNKLDLYKEVIAEIREYLDFIKFDKTDKYIPISEYDEYKHLLQILDKARENK